MLTFVLLTAALSASGCRASQPADEAAAAQATSVRRAEAAQVQRIIAGQPTPTLTPAPEPTPRPACTRAIWWYEARAHLGELRTVQGPVVSTRPMQNGSLLEVGQPYPDPTGLAIAAPAGAATAFAGKTICVAGRITTAQGTPIIQVRDSSAISVVQ